MDTHTNTNTLHMEMVMDFKESRKQLSLQLQYLDSFYTAQAATGNLTKLAELLPNFGWTFGGIVG